ncbi:hypothetical protein F2P79_008688 [Pimephales promelas]|nr:hypothetical protein F2P79_008688 [Pimephales promelas]
MASRPAAAEVVVSPVSLRHGVSVGKGKPFGAPCGLAEGKPTVGFPTETPQGPLERTRADGNHGNEETSITDKQQKIASPCFSTAFSLENHHDVLLQPCPKTTSTAMNSTRPDLDAIHTQYMTKML